MYFYAQNLMKHTNDNKLTKPNIRIFTSILLTKVASNVAKINVYLTPPGPGGRAGPPQPSKRIPGSNSP